MKAFLLPDKRSRYDHERIIIASTKKEAMKTFDDLNESLAFHGSCLKKDIREVEIIDINIRSLTIIAMNEKSLSDCFNFNMSVKVNYNNRLFQEEGTIISEDEKTTLELVNIYKTGHSDFFKNVLK